MNVLYYYRYIARSIAIMSCFFVKIYFQRVEAERNYSLSSPLLPNDRTFWSEGESTTQPVVTVLFPLFILRSIRQHQDHSISDSRSPSSTLLSLQCSVYPVDHGVFDTGDCLPCSSTALTASVAAALVEDMSIFDSIKAHVDPAHLEGVGSIFENAQATLQSVREEFKEAMREEGEEGELGAGGRNAVPGTGIREGKAGKGIIRNRV